VFSSYTSSQGSTQNEESSSASSSSEEDEKFQIRIRPAGAAGSAQGSSLGLNMSRTSLGDQSDAGSIVSSSSNLNRIVPLLPRPPRTAAEIEELRLRRLSSDTASITRSVKDDESSSGDENKPPVRRVGTMSKKTEDSSYAVRELVCCFNKNFTI
jgi:hypothetical protein